MNRTNYEQGSEVARYWVGPLAHLLRGGYARSHMKRNIDVP